MLKTEKYEHVYWARQKKKKKKYMMTAAGAL